MPTIVYSKFETKYMHKNQIEIVIHKVAPNLDKTIFFYLFLGLM